MAFLKRKILTLRWVLTSCLGFFLWRLMSVPSRCRQPWRWLSCSFVATLRTENVTVSLLCVALWGRRGPGASTVSFLWLAWMVHWWKMEITSGPTAPARFCPWEPHLFKKDFLCHGARADFCAHFYVYLGGKKWVWILFTIQSKNSLYQMLLHSLTAGRCSEALCLGCFFFFFFLYRDFPSRASGNLHSSHSILQLSVPYCINPSNLLCVCLNIRLSSVLAAALRWENTSRN